MQPFHWLMKQIAQDQLYVLVLGCHATAQFSTANESAKRTIETKLMDKLRPSLDGVNVYDMDDFRLRAGDPKKNVMDWLWGGVSINKTMNPGYKNHQRFPHIDLCVVVPEQSYCFSDGSLSRGHFTDPPLTIGAIRIARECGVKIDVATDYHADAIEASIRRGLNLQ